MKKAMRVLLVPCVAFLLFLVSSASSCSVAVTEYSAAGCSAGDLLACSRLASLAEGACHPIVGEDLYLRITDCGTGAFSLHRTADCSDTLDADGGHNAAGCSTAASAPYASVEVYADDAAEVPYCANATVECDVAMVSYEDDACERGLKCVQRTGMRDGVCAYEPRYGLYLLPRCQEGAPQRGLVLSTEPTCQFGLTRTLTNDSTGCYLFGSDETAFKFSFEAGCAPASVITNWLRDVASSLLF